VTRNAHFVFFRPSGLFRFTSGCLAVPAKPRALRQRDGPSLLPQRLAVADRPRPDRLDARTRSRARTCAGVTTSLEPHDPRPLTLSGYEQFVRERRRVVHEGYGPGFRYRTPLFPPRGILVPIPNPGPYTGIFFANREAEKHPAELQRVRVHRMV
jgi:hypothetical protein